MSRTLAATEARCRAAHRVTTSRRLAHRAWRSVAKSQKRLLWRRLRGGTADPLHEAIRLALQVNMLPRVGRGAFLSTGRGNHDCACCGLVIRPRDLEYEPHRHPGMFAHLPCFIAWRDESARLRVADGAEPGSTAAGS